jgi:hypothetical protein
MDIVVRKHRCPFARRHHQRQTSTAGRGRPFRPWSHACPTARAARRALLIAPDPPGPGRLRRRGAGLRCPVEGESLVVHEADDGADTIAGRRPALVAAVGMVSGSYLGRPVWRPPRPPPCAPSPLHHQRPVLRPWAYQGSAFQQATASSGPSALRPARAAATRQPPGRLAVWPPPHRALAAIEDSTTASPRAIPGSTPAPLLPRLAEHLRRRLLADHRPRPHLRAHHHASLVIGGWYDPSSPAFPCQLPEHARPRRRAGHRACRRPWSHSIWHGVFPERDLACWPASAWTTGAAALV